MIAPRLLHTYSLARSSVYLLESLPLGLAHRFTHPHVRRWGEKESRHQFDALLKLFKRDEQNVRDGIYNWRAFEFENPLRHARSWLGLIKDGVGMTFRKRKNQTRVFGKGVDQEGLPEYYKRNFHFQTDGYLSENSARLYDHQVEVLFGGTGGAMRRQIIPILNRHAEPKGRWLELGCGTGSATRPVAATFPKTRIVALDLSTPYLKVAQENLLPFKKVDLIQGDATKLDFKDETFDAVYSIYCLHELPFKEREQFVREAFRVLKPGGIMIMGDSVQENDDPDGNWALDRFPQLFHEPFYKNYTQDPMEGLLGRISNSRPTSELALATKYTWVKKSEHPSNV